MRISPIFYMGNKKKLIKKGLIEMFPKKIDTFYDLFGGSGVISLNTIANKYVLNDLDSNLFSLYKLFYSKKSDEIIKGVLNNIDKYHLANERTKRNVYKDFEKLKQYKKAYLNLRTDFNKCKDTMQFYTLMFYSFSQQFRFNSKGEFNMPCGNDCFSEKNQEYIKNSENFFKNHNLSICNQDFKDFNIDDMSVGDFVYLDPPYLDTIATYNEGNGWDEKKEQRLYIFLNSLAEKGIKFGMSNVIFSKGKENSMLKDFINENKYDIYHFNNFNYQSCGKTNIVDEVFISNYTLPQKQLELF